MLAFHGRNLLMWYHSRMNEVYRILLAVCLCSKIFRRAGDRFEIGVLGRIWGLVRGTIVLRTRPSTAHAATADPKFGKGVKF